MHNMMKIKYLNSIGYCRAGRHVCTHVHHYIRILAWNGMMAHLVIFEMHFNLYTQPPYM